MLLADCVAVKDLTDLLGYSHQVSISVSCLPSIVCNICHCRNPSSPEQQDNKRIKQRSIFNQSSSKYLLDRQTYYCLSRLSRPLQSFKKLIVTIVSLLEIIQCLQYLVITVIALENAGKTINLLGIIVAASLETIQCFGHLIITVINA